MNIFKFDNFAKVFCVCTVLYIYIFILSDILRLNPNDDGDAAFMGMIVGIFPTLAIISYILSDGGKKNIVKKAIIVLSSALMAGPLIFLIIFNLGDGFSEMITLLQIFFVFFLRVSVILVVPLAAYLIYKKTRQDKVSFFLLVVGVSILGLSVYPAKNYIQAEFSGDPCSTKRLIMKGYSEFKTEVYGSVVCVAKDRGYPSETYKWEVLNGADAKTFENLDDEYGRDKDSVFYRGLAIDADPKTFTTDVEWEVDQMANFVRGGVSYKKDDQNIYYEGQRVPVKDMRQFRIIDFCDSYLCATDGISVFKEGKVVPGIDPNSLFSFQTCQYTKDDKHIYHGGEVIEGADVGTFDVYGEDRYCYAYDKSRRYYEGKAVLGGAPSEFQIVKPGDVFSPYRAGSDIYYDGKKLDLDIDTFQYLGKGVSKDANSVYHGADKIEGADATTFELIPISVPQILSVCAKDRHHMYFDGEVYEHPLCTGGIF